MIDKIPLAQFIYFMPNFICGEVAMYDNFKAKAGENFFQSVCQTETKTNGSIRIDYDIYDQL